MTAETRRRGGWIAAFLWLAACAVPGQEARDVVSDRLVVTAVEIPVQVLRRGEPVRGLGPDDFEVLDRGERRAVVDFDVLDLDAPQPPGRADVRSTASRQAARARHLLLLFDLDLTDWRDLPRALHGARELLDVGLHPTDRLAVGILAPSLGVQLLHSFTTERLSSRLALDVVEAMVDREPSAAGKALAELSRVAGLRGEGLGEEEASWERLARRWIRSTSQAVGDSPLAGDQEPGPMGGRGPGRDALDIDPVRTRSLAEPSLYDEQTLRRLLFLGKSLRDLTRSLADLPEPKQLLLLSGGVPARFLDAGDHSTRVLARLDLVVKACLESGWIVQAIDVRGIPSVDEPSFDGNALFHLARETGGELLENVNNVGRAAGKILQKTRVTYVLVIQPDVPADGSYHDLEVRLRQPDRSVRLAHRAGYRAPTPADRTADLDDRRDVTQLILASGAADDETLRDFEVDVVALPLPARGGRATVPVIVEVPGEVLLENPFGGSASIEVHAYGVAPGGAVEDLFLKRLDVDLARSGQRLERGGLRLAGELSMGLGAKEVRVLVRNLANDAVSLVVTPIEVIDLSRAGLSVLPPLFVDRSRDWLSTRLAGEVPEGPSRSLADALGTEFFPALEPVVRPGRRREVVLALFYRGPTPRLQIRVLTPLGEAVEGAKVDLVRRLLGDEQGLGLVATLRPKDLRPGGYLLEVALVDPESGRRVANRTRFVVEEPS